MNIRTHRIAGAGIAVLLCAMVATAQADESEDVARLMKRIDALEQRIATLESTRTFAAFMPELAERFHVMHRAGEAGDWAVAAHELQEMKRLSQQSTSIDAERGKLLLGMMGPSYEGLESAIGHGNSKKFSKGLESTVNACNSCHAATGSEFVQVTLDAADGLSMRHPHRLMMRDAPAGHHHGPQKQGGHMMQGGMMQQGGHGKSHEHAPGTPDKHQHDGEKSQ